MNPQITASSDIGKQTGSARPLHRVTGVLFAVLLCFIPATGFAASSYLVENTPTFVNKIQSEYGDMVSIAGMLQDYDEKLILAVIVIESEGNVTAKSNRGAQGLMQLMPSTAKSLGVTDPHDPFQNILAGTRYLKELQKYYGFKSPQEALVAYNMGPSRAKRWLSEYAPEDYLYVQKVMYVHGVLMEQERNARVLTKATEEKMLAEAKIISAPKPLMTRPRNLSLASFPLVISMDSRRSTSIQEK